MQIPLRHPHPATIFPLLTPPRSDRKAWDKRLLAMLPGLMAACRVVPILLVLLSPALRAAPKFELRDGDVVAMLGDAFIEREQYDGWIELAATTRFPELDLKFRNLGWTADTPAGESRRGLSLFQAGQEPEGEGWSQLLKQLETYKPTAIILGYGMASSLPGGESPETFEKNLNRLLDEAPKASGHDIRFLILGPPPRFAKSHTDAAELATHRESLARIETILSETAAKRGLPYLSLSPLADHPENSLNGIHLTSEGYKATARLVDDALGPQPGNRDKGKAAEALRQHIIRKNEWFFNRSRPANMAYIFGFRAKEQGRNALEIPRFDSLVAREEEAIAKSRDLSKSIIIPPFPERTGSEAAKIATQPRPSFSVADGFEVSLWAENPMFHKPTQVNFDPRGRLWVASSETYPQIEVGQTTDDKIIILEDTTGDGAADKSTVFADRLSMPTAVLPDASGGAFVAQSADLLHFTDTDGDGKADSKTRVLSGFGTEDTHHNLHTLRRGPDGRIWMNQSVYTRSIVETPHGIVRLNSGGVFRFDPRNCRLEIMYRGLWNPWGHQFDKYGQSFLSDGAGFSGVTWGMPGAIFEAYTGATNKLGSVSPGAYPKFCGLEIIGSTHFPADWQGNLITCDFRAHRIVRFSIADQGAGYVTQELGDLLRSDSVNFRPIDVKTGPDGALYIADWANPIINHGEVDFRDPRRDREHGRIWRVSRKNSALEKTADFTKSSPAELMAAFSGESRYAREQATTVLFDPAENKAPAIGKPGTDLEHLSSLRLGAMSGSGLLTTARNSFQSKSGEVRASAIRHLSEMKPSTETRDLLTAAIADPFPRVRIEAILALSKDSGADSLDLSLRALALPGDRFIEYALWLHIQESGAEWLASMPDDTPSATLEFVLANLPPSEATAVIRRLFPGRLPRDGSGPWFQLGLSSGDGEVIAKIYKQAVGGGFDETSRNTALKGINDAILQRGVQPTIDTMGLAPLLEGNNITAIELAGTLASPALLPSLSRLADTSAAGLAAIRALGNYGDISVERLLGNFTGEETPLPARIAAALALARYHRDSALPAIASIAAGFTDPGAARQFWQKSLSQKEISPQLAEELKRNPLPEKAASLALRSIPDISEHDSLLKTLRLQAGEKDVPMDTATRIREIAAAAKDGDPYRGELIYRLPALACTACHAIGGSGGIIGPDMTSIGASAPLDYLIESIINPGAKVKEGYHSVIIGTTDGRAISGQLVGSSGGSLTIRDAAGNETTIPENLVATKTDAGSLMPGGLIDSLGKDQTADLFAFLSSLGKPGDFSANDSKSPKFYAVAVRNQDTMDAAARGDQSLPWMKINATVNGRLLPSDYYSSGLKGGTPMIATKIQLAEPGELTVTFAEGFHPAELYINGQPTTGTTRLPAGTHTVVFRADKLDGPVRLRSNTGTFLPEW